MHYTRPTHPPPDPPIPETSMLGQDIRHSLYMPHCLTQADLEHNKQRYSFPDRLVRSRSSDIVCPGRRPTSDPCLNRRVAVEEREPAGAFALGPTSSPSKDSLKGEVRRASDKNVNTQHDRIHMWVGCFLSCHNFIPQVEDRKDSDDEKSDRNRPWWKKRFVSAIPKGKEKLTSLIIYSELKNDLLGKKIDLFMLLCLLLLKGKKANLIASDRMYQTLKSRQFILWETE